MKTLKTPTLIGAKVILQVLVSPAVSRKTPETKELFPFFPFTVSVGLKAFLSSEAFPLLSNSPSTMIFMAAVSPAWNVLLSFNQLKAKFGTFALSARDYRIFFTNFLSRIFQTSDNQRGKISMST